MHGSVYFSIELHACHHSPAAVVLALMDAVGPAPALVPALTPIV